MSAPSVPYIAARRSNGRFSRLVTSGGPSWAVALIQILGWTRVLPEVAYHARLALTNPPHATGLAEIRHEGVLLRLP
jgi:hypothetical protein